MMQDFTINYYFDKRFKNKENKYNIRLSVYNRNIEDASKRRKMFTTPFWFTEKEWNEIICFTEIKAGKKSKEYLVLESKILPIRREMDAFIEEANIKAKSIEIFSFESFKKLLFRKNLNVGNTIPDYYQRKISSFNQNDQVGTASNYDSSLKSLISFRNSKKIISQFTFSEVDAAWLLEYEKWMIRNDKSNSTVGIYLRPLRAIFNDAIADKIISFSQYPFHNKENKNGYKIPASKKVKKALEMKDLKALFNSKTLTPEEEEARDFFFFSYLSNGMNTKDIALLKWNNISDNSFTFIRAKTANTTKSNQLPIVVPIVEYHKKILLKYGTPIIKTDYVFPILKKGMNAEEMKRRINAFTRFINQHIKKVAKRHGISEKISTYWARHSFATQLMNNNTSTEFIKQALGHNSLTTTNNYLNSFSSDIQEEKINSLYKNLNL